MTDTQFDEYLGRKRTRLRLVGYAFLSLGMIALIYNIIVLNDPARGIKVNHVIVYDYHVKLRLVEFLSIFPGVGAVLVLIPRRVVDSFFKLLFGRL
jgi:hypothetical protein